jgi:hypothetical protein
MTKYVFIFLAFIFQASLSYGAGFSLFTGLNRASRTLEKNNQTQTSSNSAYGYGFFVGIPLDKKSLTEIETGLLYLPKESSYRNEGPNIASGSASVSATITDHLNYFHIPVLFRLNPLQFLSLGAGLQYSRGIGAVETQIQYSGVSKVYSRSFDEAGFHKDELAAVGSVRVSFPIAIVFGISLDVRYIYGFTDIDSTPQTSYSRDLQILGGFGLFF